MSNMAQETSLRADLVRYIRYQLRGRRGLIAAAIVLAIPALWFSWPWLVVAGIAPILIAFAPCALMCAVGLCTMKSCSTSKDGQVSACSKAQTSDQTPGPTTAKRLADGTAKPLVLTAPPQALKDADEVESGLHLKEANQGSEIINQEKEKLQ